MSRYIMDRVCEIAGVVCSLDPKPVPGDWNGTGCHTNFSTQVMREEGGLEYIKKAIYKLGAKHAEHIAWYGEGNDRRLTGHHETASIHNFSWGVAHRGASVRVGRDTARENKGYFEDRRPAANMDPYRVTSKIADTTLLWNGDAPAIAPKVRARGRDRLTVKSFFFLSLRAASSFFLFVPSSFFLPSCEHSFCQSADELDIAFRCRLPSQVYTEKK